MDTRSNIAIGATVITIFSLAVSWYQIKRKGKRIEVAKIVSSPSTSWKRVGSVKEILYYPLKSGKFEELTECNFDRFGIRVDDGTTNTNDRMFIAYNEKTRKTVTAGSYPDLILVKITVMNKYQAQLEVNSMAPLIFDLPKIDDKNARVVRCSKWFQDPLKCIDCGDEASEWLARFLTQGSRSDIRLGVFIVDERKNYARRLLDKYVQLYSAFKNDDTGLFQNLTSYMILSQPAVDDLNQRLTERGKKEIASRQLRPNIVVDGCDPFAEDNWEWIKIGNDAIIRKVALCTRCIMIRTNPDTGIPDPDFEPYRTLSTYRRLKCPILSSLANHAPAIGIYCGLVRSGKVYLGDDVFVYQGNEN